MIIAIGASTGGVDALLEVLSHFSHDCPPTFLVQHMRPSFLMSFAERLDNNCQASVSAANNGDLVRVGQIKIAATGDHHLSVVRNGHIECRVEPGGAISGHVPSVDVLFHSVSKLPGPRLGVILTGMGRDGAGGLLAMRRSGAHTIGQNQESCTVFGMPRAAAELGACSEVLPLSRIGARLMDLAKSNSDQRRKLYG